MYFEQSKIDELIDIVDEFGSKVDTKKFKSKLKELTKDGSEKISYDSLSSLTKLSFRKKFLEKLFDFIFPFHVKDDYTLTCSEYFQNYQDSKICATLNMMFSEELDNSDVANIYSNLKSLDIKSTEDFNILGFQQFKDFCFYGTLNALDNGKFYYSLYYLDNDTIKSFYIEDKFLKVFKQKQYFETILKTFILEDFYIINKKELNVFVDDVLKNETDTYIQTIFKLFAEELFKWD